MTPTNACPAGDSLFTRPCIPKFSLQVHWPMSARPSKTDIRRLDQMSAKCQKQKSRLVVQMSSAAADLALPDRRRVTAFSYKLPSPHLTQPSRLGATR